MNNKDFVKNINALCKKTFVDNLGIKFTEISDNEIIAEMKIKKEHLQPAGFLHGGISLSIGETVGSVLSVSSTDMSKYMVFGTQLNSYHLRSVRKGKIIAKAKFIHKGNSSHIIEIEIFNDNGDEIYKNCHINMINRVLKKEDFNQ